MGRWVLSGVGGILAIVVAAIGLGVATVPTPWTPPQPPGGVPHAGDIDVEPLAQAIGAYLRIDTRNPPGPEAYAEVRLEAEALSERAEDAPPPEPRERPAWMHHLVSRYATPMGLTWKEVEGALAIFVPSDDAQPPVVWLSHADVVPVDEAELDRWTHPPLDGVVADGFLWGRGALDNKSSTILQLDAVARMQRDGETASRKVVILVTPDEETGGPVAAAVAARGLEALGNPDTVLDEGSYVLPDLMDGSLVAGVAVSEKTFASFDFAVRAEGGHSSMPSGESAIDILAEAVTKVTAWETPATITPAMREGFSRLAGHRAFPESLVLGHAGVLQPLLLPMLQKTPAGNAITRDTIVVTMLNAGVKDNVIPADATATANARLLPSTEPEQFLADLNAVVDDERVVITPHAWNARAGEGSWDTDTFRAIEAVLPVVVEGAVVIPSLTPATMDARHFAAAGLHTYRFHPFVLDAAERKRLHGLDERVSLDNLVRGARFYRGLLSAL